jgi:hypothetical protein
MKVWKDRNTAHILNFSSLARLLRATSQNFS